MKYISEFQNQKVVHLLAQRIHEVVQDQKMTLMEVCGTHTMAIARFGIKSILPEQLRLISGPGCPVCVTSISYVDHAIELAKQPDVVITTFGDMMRVPGSVTNLEQERSRGAQVKIVTSTLDAISLAQSHPDKKVVFLGVGFETTIPTVGIAIQAAQEKQLQNFFVLSAHKIMPPAMRALCQGDIALDGFLCPGHVSTITGLSFYEQIVQDFNKGCVIAGFEPIDLLQGILMLCQQIRLNEYKVENQYKRIVQTQGNPRAMSVINAVFESCDTEWRGLGDIPQSGLKIRSEYSHWDASVQFDVEIPPSNEPVGCRCGDVLTGKINPDECPLFGKTCTTDFPIGACMVSSEGSCAAAYRYRPVSVD
ncbi:hydrogenase formation protein HypD [bacterium]